MDRMVYVAMSGAKETLRAQAANNHNLANASTTGFKADLTSFRSRALTGPGFASRVYASASSMGWDQSVGSLTTTGNPLDLAVQGPGYLAVQDANGREAYTRAGDLHVDPSGMLMTSTGQAVLGDSGPLSVPPGSQVTIAGDGTISVIPPGQSPQTSAAIGRIKLVNPPTASLQAGPDGLFYTTDGAAAGADASVTLSTGVLESSNVNLAGSMVDMIELARKFELQVKALHAAEEDAASATKLLQSG